MGSEAAVIAHGSTFLNPLKQEAYCLHPRQVNDNKHRVQEVNLYPHHLNKHKVNSKINAKP